MKTSKFAFEIIWPLERARRWGGGHKPLSFGFPAHFGSNCLCNYVANFPQQLRLHQHLHSTCTQQQRHMRLFWAFFSSSFSPWDFHFLPVEGCLLSGPADDLGTVGICTMHGLWSSNEAFFFIEIPNFWAWADKFWGIWGNFVQFISTLVYQIDV